MPKEWPEEAWWPKETSSPDQQWINLAAKQPQPKTTTLHICTQVEPEEPEGAKQATKPSLSVVVEYNQLNWLELPGIADNVLLVPGNNNRLDKQQLGSNSQRREPGGQVPRRDLYHSQLQPAALHSRTTANWRTGKSSCPRCSWGRSSRRRKRHLAKN